MLGWPNRRSSPRHTPAEGPSTLGDLGARYGFRRVECVHILVDNGRTVAEVTGVVHRYPRTVRVPLRFASRLVAAGAPLAIEGTDSLVPEDA